MYFPGIIHDNLNDEQTIGLHFWKLLSQSVGKNNYNYTIKIKKTEERFFFFCDSLISDLFQHSYRFRNNL